MIACGMLLGAMLFYVLKNSRHFSNSLRVVDHNEKNPALSDLNCQYFYKRLPHFQIIILEYSLV